MRPRMEKDLHDFSELAKDQAKIEIASKEEQSHNSSGPDSEMVELSGAIDWHLAKAANKQQTGKDVQQEIFDI